MFYCSFSHYSWQLDSQTKTFQNEFLGDTKIHFWNEHVFSNIIFCFVQIILYNSRKKYSFSENQSRTPLLHFSLFSSNAYMDLSWLTFNFMLESSAFHLSIIKLSKERNSASSDMIEIIQLWRKFYQSCFIFSFSYTFWFKLRLIRKVYFVEAELDSHL